jgi:hypothetical protein
MTIEESAGGLGKNDALVVQFRDAMTATAHMKARQSRALKEHSESLQEHDKAIAASKREWDRRMNDLDNHIRDLVSGFGAYVRLSPTVVTRRRDL